MALVSGNAEILEALLDAGGTLQHPFLITDAADQDSLECLAAAAAVGLWRSRLGKVMGLMFCGVPMVTGSVRKTAGGGNYYLTKKNRETVRGGLSKKANYFWRRSFSNAPAPKAASASVAGSGAATGVKVMPDKPLSLPT